MGPKLAETASPTDAPTMTIAIATYAGIAMDKANNVVGVAVGAGTRNSEMTITVAALTRLRDRRLWLLVGAALAAVALAAGAGLSKGEVERIWLPFTIWVLPAGAALAPPGRHDRAAQGWLGLQGTAAVLVQSLLKPRW